LHNAAAICRDGAVRAVYRKQELPTYGVFDEERWFTPGAPDQPLFDLDGLAIGVSVCEDLWIEDGPLARQCAAGAQLLVNINGSPYHQTKVMQRQDLLAARAVAGGAPIVYVNQVGGQDELVFDGGSMVVDGTGRLRCRLAQFESAFQIVDVPLDPEAPCEAPVAPVLDDAEERWQALVLGTRDYVRKNGFSDVVIGLSGGVDSSLVAAIAVDALGADRVHGVLMPSRYSSGGSVTDAEALARRLDIEIRVVEIEPAHIAFESMLAASFEGREPDITEENLQSRLRGVILMALSNKFGWMVLTTGNKSESAVGYSTLYGDTAGGLAVIKDVYKTTVYELCRWRNEQAGTELIPEAVLSKAPSAELRPEQRDDQSLPPYDVLDPILEGYVDGDLTVADLVDAGSDAAVVQRICRLVDIAEYKRRQSPPGIRVSAKAFGRDRRLPITNHYR
jgi:NAD+ synthase (glutamine-hydrolysing)